MVVLIVGFTYLSSFVCSESKIPVILILASCDSSSPSPAILVQHADPLTMSQDIEELVYGNEANRYLHEVGFFAAFNLTKTIMLHSK